MNTKKPKLHLLAALLVCAWLAPVAGVAKDQQQKPANPGISPPEANAYGASYHEWAARWWQWVAAIPLGQNPAVDDTGQYAAEGQSGHVWFLTDVGPGTLGPGDAITRTCDIPVGKALFFPVWNVIWFTVPGVDCPVEQDPLEWFLENEGWIRELMGSVTIEEVSCEIDGRPIQNLDRYHVQSPVFTMDLPENNILWPEPQVFTACMSDGMYLMLAPLSAGPHTIHSRAVLEWSFFPGGHSYVDVTYHLTVVPANR
ncbi:MAG: hypothetical protein AB9869_16490 [Verrucomicrobiia bacterium]